MKYRSYLNGTALVRPIGGAVGNFQTRLTARHRSAQAFQSGGQQRTCGRPQPPHTRSRGTHPGIAAAALLYLFVAPLAFGQSLNSILSRARTVKAPGSGMFKPDDNAHPFGTSNGNTSLAVRNGTVTLSNGTVLAGKVWTTLKTPFRVWLADIKQYRDIDIRLIKTIRVHVLAAKQIRDWRYQQEGSDIKNYSGKTRPRISFAYTFTMLKGKPITGTLDAPLYVRAHGHTSDLIIYKRVEGKLGEKLSAVVYVKSVTLQVTPAIAHYAAGLTRKLPMIHWRKMLASAHARN